MPGSFSAPTHLSLGYSEDEIAKSEMPKVDKRKITKEEIAIARKGLVEADKPLLKDLAGLGVTVTTPNAAEREAFVKATRPVFDKWKNQIGAPLVEKAEKAIAASQK